MLYLNLLRDLVNSETFFKVMQDKSHGEVKYEYNINTNYF